MSFDYIHPFPNFSQTYLTLFPKHSILCSLYLLSIHLNFCFLYIHVYLAFYWRIVNLPVAFLVGTTYRVLM